MACSKGVLGYHEGMSLQAFLTKILVFINEIAIPFILALAFLFFLFNIARYFIFEGGNDSGREKARQSALWGILGFVIIASIWGVVNLLVYGLGFDQESSICPDYNPNCVSRSSGSGSSNGGAWSPSSGENQQCILGISCATVGGVRTCEYCFISEY